MHTPVAAAGAATPGAGAATLAAEEVVTLAALASAEAAVDLQAARDTLDTAAVGMTGATPELIVGVTAGATEDGGAGTAIAAGGAVTAGAVAMAVGAGEALD